MAALRLRCHGCGTAFYGRADARYCCNACRQKAHRVRARRIALAATVPPLELSRALTQAQQNREVARTARLRAEAARRAAQEIRVQRAVPR
ncbi:hypothetical protein MSAS_20230 [Mycobacterium saskatchewanense]|nr:hypothetical protein MSAS_20230 [Mycobacterium saskatchewanense]